MDKNSQQKIVAEFESLLWNDQEIYVLVRVGHSSKSGAVSTALAGFDILLKSPYPEAVIIRSSS